MLNAYREAVYQDTHQEVNRQVDREFYHEVDQDSDEVTCWESNHEVNLMVAEADIEWWLMQQDESTCQCVVPMTTSCKISSRSMRKHNTALRER